MKNFMAAVKENRIVGLLWTQRFGPFFWTQTWGAFNDNLFKTALIVLLAFETATGGIRSHYMTNLAAGLFILPFFLFSGLAGQIADKYEKSLLIRRLKLAEIIIMLCAVPALMLNQTWLLLTLLFAMGIQAAFFGPVKYSILPQHLSSSELIAGNGFVEMGTFVAILLGAIAGSFLAAAHGGRIYVTAAVVLSAIAGWIASRRIPSAAASDPKSAIGWNPLSGTGQAIRLVYRNRIAHWCAAGISWFWFVGSAYLTQLPDFVRLVIEAPPAVVTWLLAAFTVGIGGGSMTCRLFSGRRLELGLIPLGAFVMAAAGWDLSHISITTYGLSPWAPSPTVPPGMLTGILIDLVLIGAGGGVYIVPLFALMQIHTPSAVLSRVIAGNNIINALAMVAAAIAAVLLLGPLDLSISAFFGYLAVGNLIVCAMACWKMPIPVVRFIINGTVRAMYRLRYSGIESIPESGPAVLVCNHVSYVDALIIAGASPRPVRFVMHIDYYRIPILKWFFRLAGAIPIDSGRKNPHILRDALMEIDSALAHGDLICLFPEGQLTRDGQIQSFRPGIEKIVARHPAPVVPLALRGLWGSFFSHYGGKALHHRPRRIRARVELAAGTPFSPTEVNVQVLQDRIGELRGEIA